MGYIDATKLGSMLTSAQKICVCRRFFTFFEEVEKCPWFTETNQPMDVKMAFIMKSLINDGFSIKMEENGMINLCTIEESRAYLAKYKDKFEELDTWRKAKWGK